MSPLSQVLPGSNHVSDPATFTWAVLLIPALVQLGFPQFPQHGKRERWVTPRRRALEGAQCLVLSGELRTAVSQQWRAGSCSNLILYSRQVQKAQNHLHLVGHSVTACNSEAREAQENLSKVWVLSDF